MSSSRASKRGRYGRSSYHDTLPLVDKYDIIHLSEASARTVRGVTHTTRRQDSPEIVAGAWEALSSWDPPDDHNVALNADASLYNLAVEAPVMEERPPQCVLKKKYKKSLVSQRPNVVWKDYHRQTYLEEIIRWAGRGDFVSSSHCMDCLARKVDRPGPAKYRCMECFSPDLTCQSCCVKRHRYHPFHRIEGWTRVSFDSISLRSLGLKVQLNHASGRCDAPIACHASMLVLHVNGIHSVDIQYCGCERMIPNHIQLLCRRLYPASQVNVKTCAMFELLRHLHKLALTTKASMYDFYRCLEKSTTNLGINPPKSRYRALFRMILQWRHLQMLKWAGRCHDEGGAVGTLPGALAVQCPTCPYPGINIPDGWKDVPESERFLYRTIICMDANFRLKNQLVSNYSQDPGLGIGMAYMVPRTGYEAYVLSHAKDEDLSTCVGFQALAKANTKFSKGLRYTGVGMGCCGRSEMVMPLGVGNLQKGERYANMDYIFAMILRAIAVCWILISYDIACQWFSNLQKRINDEWPEEIKPSAAQIFKPAIPKLHEQMHKELDHQVYSFKYIGGVGLTDGECPERIWAPHNILGNATKTQGPGSRQDTLDDHFGYWNWLKYTSTGTTLLRKYRNAVRDRNSLTEAHDGLTASIPGSIVDKWERICRAWERDRSKKNPYYTPDTTLSQAEVKKRLEESEEEFKKNGGYYPHETTASKFVSLALDIEDTQRRLRQVAKTTKSGSAAQKGLSENRTLLLSRIQDWEKLLPLYIPGLLQYQVDYPEEAENSDHAEDYKLWLPSAIPEPHRARITMPDLIHVEVEFRFAQMNDSLNAMRQILRIKSRMVEFKNKNIRGQRSGTHSRAVIDCVHERARGAAAKYRVARAAYLALVGPGDWEAVFRVLNDGDIRGYQDPERLRPRVGRRGTLEDGQAEMSAELGPEDEGEFTLFNEPRSRRDGTGETRRVVSWIWNVVEGDTGGPIDKVDNEIQRVEWSKSRARKVRATEEVRLLKEEMRRALSFLEWKAKWWLERESARQGLLRDMREAVSAYANKQAHIQTSLRAHFQKLWDAPFNDETIPGDDYDYDDSEDEYADDSEDEDEDEGEGEAEGRDDSGTDPGDEGGSGFSDGGEDG